MSPLPSEFPRRVLLAVVGLTPQVVTETMWALARRQVPAFVPTEVQIVATAAGCRLAELALVRQRRLAALAAELGVPAPDLRVWPVERGGTPVEDLQTVEDHTALADLLLARLRVLTHDPSTAVHVSLAGGRKTMSFLAGYVLSLLAREQDRLSHVLVSPPFEGHPEFFWPSPASRPLLPVGGGSPLEPSQAEVALVEVPFVRLRDELPADLLATARPFAEAVAAAQVALAAPPSLTIELLPPGARAGEFRLPLAPVQLAFLLVLARRRAAGDGAVSWRELAAGEVLHAYAELFGREGSGFERLAAALARGVEPGWFQERKARHDKLVVRALGRRAGPYRLEPVGQRPVTRWRLALPPERITICKEASGP